MKEHLYFDNAADTPICKEALDKLNEVFASEARNAGSLHFNGRTAAMYLEEARDIIASTINASSHEIIFTSGGTESDNMALIGFARANKNRGNHIISSVAEHPAVLQSLKKLESEGFKITLLPVNGNCKTDFELIKGAITDKTILLSLMHVNNEVGTVNDISRVAKLAHERNIAFHSDCVQSYTKLPIDVKQMNIDMLGVSSHKFHGPCGVGFLYVKNGIALDPVIYGGRQERSLRPGTQSAPLIASMAQAAKVMCEFNAKNKERIKAMRDRLIDTITAQNSGASLNGSLDERIYDNINISFGGVTADSMLYALDDAGLSVSGGSACEAGTLEISHVIKAMAREDFGAPIRLTLSSFTKQQDIDKASEIINIVYSRLLHYR